MSKIDPNSPARPYAAEWGYKDVLSIRAELASRNMASMMADLVPEKLDDSIFELIAFSAIRSADILIKQLNQSDQDGI